MASGNRRFVTYTNIDPGDYVFRVRGSNNDGLWSNQQAAVRITITPPFWATWWFRLLLIAMVIALAYFWHRIRLYKIETKKKELERLVSLRTAELNTQKALVENQAAQLIEMDRIKSHFFANISHEFRTPLTLILGPLEDLINSQRHQRTAKVFMSMRKNARQLLDLINQLLDLSKLESGQMTLRPDTRDIIRFIGEIVQSFTPLAERQQVILEFRAQIDSLICSFDPDKMEKIIKNLLSNAFKFTPQNGFITVTVGESSGTVTIDVQDTGSGIPSESLPYIFDRFYQSVTNADHNKTGTGIGLALTKDLVELHEGVIRVESAPGQGSRFTIALPIRRGNLQQNESQPELTIARQQTWEGGRGLKDKAAATENENQQANPPAIVEGESGAFPGKKSGLILLIEDNPDVQQYIKEKLISTYRIITADDGEAGLAKARQQIPDLIISDLMLPKLDGHDLCKTLKSESLTSHIPVIILTAKASDTTKIESLETGADDYLTKPFDVRELKIRVKNLIDQRRNLRRKFTSQVIATAPGSIPMPSLDQAFLQKIGSIIEERSSNPDFNVEALSREAGLSRKQLHRKLRALTDQSPSQFIRTLRLKRAMELLQQQTASVSEIAYSVGFNHLSYFSKCFRRQFGHLPSEYEKIVEE